MPTPALIEKKTKTKTPTPIGSQTPNITQNDAPTISSATGNCLLNSSIFLAATKVNKSVLPIKDKVNLKVDQILSLIDDVLGGQFPALPSPQPALLLAIPALTEDIPALFPTLIGPIPADCSFSAVSKCSTAC